MQSLKNAIAAQQVANVTIATFRCEFESMDIRGKLSLLVSDPDFRKNAEQFLHHDSSYSGTHGSLYDDFYWDRRETKSLDSVFETVLDSIDYPAEEEPTNEELVDLIMSLKDGDKESVLIDMLNKNLGSATYDW